MMRILVTGSGGFIGRRLLQVLKKVGHTPLELARNDGDIADPATLRRLEGLEIDFVFHLAGRTFVPDAWREPAEFQRVNVTGTLNVLELCRARKIPLTYVSAYLYGIPASLPVRETDPIAPNNPYALSKFLAESACRFYGDYLNVPVTIIRPFNIFGPGQKAHFLIPEIIAHVKAGQPIILKDLSPRRDYLYLDDLTDALVRTLEPQPGCRVFNIGSGQSLSVAQIVDVIQSVAGTTLPVTDNNTPRKNEISDVYADISEAAQGLRWQPQRSFKQGIEQLMRMESELHE